jgi:hypothetical protein
MVLWLSPKLCQNEALKVPLECLQALCESTGCLLSVIADLGLLQEAYKKHQADRGSRSRPWTRFAALVADEAECKERTSPQVPRLARTFHSWLAERSGVNKKNPLVFW